MGPEERCNIKLNFIKLIGLHRVLFKNVKIYLLYTPKRQRYIPKGKERLHRNGEVDKKKIIQYIYSKKIPKKTDGHIIYESKRKHKAVLKYPCSHHRCNPCGQRKAVQ